MDTATAKKLVLETLEGPFNKECFADLTRNMLNHIEDAPFPPGAYRGRYIWHDFADSIQLIERVGKFIDPDDKQLDVLIVHLKKDTSLERARTKQRNLIAKYLNGGRDGVLKDAALVAFVAPNGTDWRFSFVKMEYKFDEKGKVKEDFTPARRYSFLVGENENSHTAQSRLLPILLNDETDPTLDDLEQAFSVERVTREFFEKYRDLFLQIKESLDAIVKHDAKIKDDFKAKHIDTADFAKKLLGQIVFLYFLQKKGWFGVKRGKAWGSGSKHFLRELFEKKHGGYNNFFNNILEPLFYEALRLERPKDYYDQFKCRIPFLNGGLFDPINDYDWQDTDIEIPDDIFSNTRRTEEGDTGAGVLDIFDRYNFTVKEDEPMEKEVAVDPEMLGKVFENLLEVNDRKSKGTYYTPREIVHYMCRQSLVNYLYSELNHGIVTYEQIGDSQMRMLGNEASKKQLDLTIEHRPQPLISKEDIETLVQYGESVVDHDSRVASKGRETKTYAFKLPRNVREQARLIDQKLAEIRVCDPAVGSGAFVVGMMNEMIRTRNALTPYIGENEERSPYHFKWQAIRHCLYGVDIDPGAVEIAKLRLWLSLVVDEEERETIQPLPNLDYKIVCGNSLLSIKKLFHHQGSKQIEKLKPRYFNETNANKKQQYKEQIDKLFSEITNGRKDFDFEVYFSEVFHEKQGFDVVIGNPPYIQLQREGGKLGKLYQNKGFTTFAKTGDIYQLFYEKGLRLARKEQGLLTFITSNSWQRAKYGEKLRQFFSDSHNPLQLIDMGKDVFENVVVDSNILCIRNGKAGQAFKAVDMDNLPQPTFPPDRKHWVTITPQGAKPWNFLPPLQESIQAKIERLGTPLKDWDAAIYRGVTTGCNEAFIIDSAKRDELILADPRSEEIIKPILRGRDIKRYQAKWAGRYLICTFPALSLDIFQYPAVKRHLTAFGKTRLEQSGKKLENGLKTRKESNNKWFEMQDTIAYYPEFAKEKLIWIELVDRGRFAYVSEEIYCNNTAYILTGTSIKYLCAFLNSQLASWILKTIAASSGNGNFSMD